MFQLDDKFLADVGLGGLPEDQKAAFLEYFREQLELRVGTRLSEGLTETQLDEFESFIDRDEAKVNTWLAANTPDYQNDPAWQQLKASADAVAEEQPIPEIAVKAEYASLKWLSLNRPDYRNVVAAVMGELRDETVKNREAILGQVSGGEVPPVQ